MSDYRVRERNSSSYIVFPPVDAEVAKRRRNEAILRYGEGGSGGGSGRNESQCPEQSAVLAPGSVSTHVTVLLDRDGGGLEDGGSRRTGNRS